MLRLKTLCGMLPLDNAYPKPFEIMGLPWVSRTFLSLERVMHFAPPRERKVHDTL